MEAETKGKWSGVIMTDEEIKDWEQAFIDIEESIELVYKKGKNI